MKFGEAITLLNAGHKVTREGWNGKGMFLLKAGGYKVHKDSLRPNSPINKEFLESRGLDEMEILPHIDMWTVNSSGRQAYLPGWLASQSDMLADDWMVYQDAPKPLVEVKVNPKPHWTQTPEGKKIMAARKKAKK